MCSKQKKIFKLHDFNMITGINYSKILTKHISCMRQCSFDSIKCNLDQKWNNDKSRCECKNLEKTCVQKKIKFGILLLAVVEMVNI